MYKQKSLILLILLSHRFKMEDENLLSSCGVALTVLTDYDCTYRMACGLSKLLVSQLFLAPLKLSLKLKKKKSLALADYHIMVNITNKNYQK